MPVGAEWRTDRVEKADASGSCADDLRLRRRLEERTAFLLVNLDFVNFILWHLFVNLLRTKATENI